MTILLSPQAFEPATISDPNQLLQVLQQLRHAVYTEGQVLFNRWQPLLQRRHFWQSALNLADYLALRRHDLRTLQAALMPWGLSSLGRIEARVMPNLDAVIATLARICHQDPDRLPHHPPIEAFFEGDRLLQQNTNEVFGPPSPHRRVRIMPTLPTEAATDNAFVAGLLGQGADCVRINCAHDQPTVWQAMIDQVRKAEAALGKSCKVLMDLGGPKPRTDQIWMANPKHRLQVGDSILLTRATPHLDLGEACQVSCTLPEILAQLRVGDTVWIDDGHLGARVEAHTAIGVRLQVIHTRPKGEKLKPQKGLNFPDTNLQLSPLTEQDYQALDFVAIHADIVGYSFVQEAADIVLLQQELRARLPKGQPIPAIVAKIETPRAVQNLPELIIHAAGQQPFGVMIARGDLAVELGYQRLAEMQEEILWICEAAHVPVIWATQVLETLVKKGMPSRAEITDAAMSERSECVMLNKGPFLPQAITILDDVLTRMQAHQMKKTPQLRALRSWYPFHSDL